LELPQKKLKSLGAKQIIPQNVRSPSQIFHNIGGNHGYLATLICRPVSGGTMLKYSQPGCIFGTVVLGYQGGQNSRKYIPAAAGSHAGIARTIEVYCTIGPYYGCMCPFQAYDHPVLLGKLPG
jgi:hypothetical protein